MNAPLPTVQTAERTFRTVDDVTVHVVTAGDPTDPLVVLLHGFPEFWYGWRRYVEPFVEAGYRVLVPDQRGYNRSDKPDDVRQYRRSQLADDVVALVETEDRDAAHIVGHDWGGTVAWDLALRHPGVVDRLCVVNMPHPTVFERARRSNPAQRARSQYIRSFQAPDRPERRLRSNDYESLAGVMRRGAKRGTFDETDIERYRRAWSEDGALTAMLNWYRALEQYSDDPPRDDVTPPTLVVWGENDQALVPDLAPESLDYCADGTLEQFPDATHWVHQEYPTRVFELLRSHLGSE